MARSRHMSLGVVFNQTGRQVASRRNPEAQANAGIGVQHFSCLSDRVGLREASMAPDLQRRGLFHRDSAGRTLREQLGLVRPASRSRA